MKNILIVSGSNGKNLEMANEFKKTLESIGANVKILDLVDKKLPLYTPLAQQNGAGENFDEILSFFEKAQGLVFLTPEYNGGIAPTITNLIAWVSTSAGRDWRKYFNGKIGAIGSFSGSGGFQALYGLRAQLSYIGLNLIGRQVIGTHVNGLKAEDIEGVSQEIVKYLN
jgi:chromate reductase